MRQCLGLAILSLLILSSRAWALDSEEVAEPGWIPSFNVGFEAFSLKTQTSAENLKNPPIWSDSGNFSIPEFQLMLGAELASPPLRILPGRPRLFVSGGIGVSMDTEDRTLNLGDPRAPGEPEREISAYESRLLTSIARNCLNFEPDRCPRPDVPGFSGQGSDVTVNLDTVTWQANFGASFDINLFKNQIIQVRPSVAYRGEKVQLGGILSTAVLEELVLADPPTVDISVFRSRTSAQTTLHNLGPRLELALVLSKKARPIRTSLYVEGSFLWRVNDGFVQMADPEQVARYSVHFNETSGRGGAGIRFSWVGRHGAR